MDRTKHTRTGSSGDKATDLAEVLKQMAAMNEKLAQEMTQKMEQNSENLKHEMKQEMKQQNENLKQDIAQSSQNLENKLDKSSEENRLNSVNLENKIDSQSEENKTNNENLRQEISQQSEKIENEMKQNSDKLREEVIEKLDSNLEIVSQTITQLENKIEEQRVELKKEMIEELAKLEGKLAQHTEDQRQFVNDVIGGWEGRLEEITQGIEDKCLKIENTMVIKVEEHYQKQEIDIEKLGKQTKENQVSQQNLRQELREIEVVTQQQGEKIGLVEHETVEMKGNLLITRKELDDIIIQLSKRDDTIKTSIRTEINQLRRQQNFSHNNTETYTPNNWVKPHLWPKFKGNGDKIHPLTFLKTILHYTQDIVDDQVRLNIIRTVLQDRAMEWAEMTMDKCETIDDFKQAFMRQYWGNGQQDRLKIQLMTGRYIEGTNSRENYAIDLFNKCKYLEAFDEAEIAKYLLNHFLLVDQHAIIGQEVHNIDQLIEFLRKLDDLELAKKRNRMSYRPQNTQHSHPYSHSNTPYNNNNHNNHTNHSHNYNSNNQQHYQSRAFNSHQNGNNNHSYRNYNHTQNTPYHTQNHYNNNQGNRQTNTYSNNHPRNPGYNKQGNRPENYRPNDRNTQMISNTYVKRGKPATKPNYFSWIKKKQREEDPEDIEEDEETEKQNDQVEKKKTPILKWRRDRSHSPTPTTSAQH